MTESDIRLLTASLSQRGLSHVAAIDELSFESGSDQSNGHNAESLSIFKSSTKRIAFDGSVHLLSDQELTVCFFLVDSLTIRVLNVLLILSACFKFYWTRHGPCKRQLLAPKRLLLIHQGSDASSKHGNTTQIIHQSKHVSILAKRSIQVTSMFCMVFKHTFD